MRAGHTVDTAALLQSLSRDGKHVISQTCFRSHNPTSILGKLIAEEQLQIAGPESRRIG